MNAQRRRFTAQVGSFLAIGASGHSVAQQSIIRPFVTVYPNYPDQKIFEINVPGSYALNKDEIQGSLSGAGHTGPKGGYMLNIHCGSVKIDLNEHTIGADYGVGGISFPAKRKPIDKDYLLLYGSAYLDCRFVTLENGTIDLARGNHTGRGVKFSNEWQEPDEQTGERGTPSCGRYGGCPAAGIAYVQNDYRFQKLKILTLCSALAAEGSHTVIRDCVIESAGTAAIFIAGPNVTIENCEIRLRKLAEGPYSFLQPTRAAIVLHDGSNAVIRNNRIRVDYGGVPSDTHCILVHDGATNVLVEGNTFINVEGDPVTLTGGSQASFINNRSERRWLPL